MSRWLDRPGYVAIAAFAGGVAVAAVVVLLVVITRGDGENDGRQVAATATAERTPAGTPTTTGPSPTAGPRPTTLTTELTDPDEALEAFIRDVLESEHIGGCPQVVPPDGPPAGVCSEELYRSQELVAFLVGTPFSEFFGETLLTRNEDETWSVTFFLGPAKDTTIAIGSEAMVYGAGSCLNFRAEPSLAADVRTCWRDGTRAVVMEGPVTADGHTWWRLERLGWASEQYLVPVG